MSALRVLVACEFSGRVRDAFRRRGHIAVSADLVPSERPGPHYVGDARDLLQPGRWDLLIAHPPCTYLSRAGAHLMGKHPERAELQRQGVAVFLDFLNAPVPRVAVENPTMFGYAREVLGQPSQVIQPHEYGTLETKRTGLWLRNLPPLLADVDAAAATAAQPREVRQRLWYGQAPRKDPEVRRRERSRTAWGIAEAMAEQWGSAIEGEQLDIFDALAGVE